jgi:hypothetical protein
MHINQTSLVIMLVMVTSKWFKFHLVPYQGSTFANNSNFFGNRWLSSIRCFFSNSLGRQVGYSATSAGGSNFGRQVGYKAQQVLITQIFRVITLFSSNKC